MNQSLYDHPISGELKYHYTLGSLPMLNSEIPLCDPNQLDAWICLVIDAAKTKGPIFRKVTVVDTQPQEVIEYLLDGQYVEPLKHQLQHPWSEDALLKWGGK
jgi:hypothetical protein